MALTKIDTGYRKLDPALYNAILDEIVLRQGPQPSLVKSQGNNPSAARVNPLLAYLNTQGSAFPPLSPGDHVFHGGVVNAVIDAVLALPFRRCAVTNNCNLPTNYNTIATNWVHNDWTTHYTATALSALDLYYVNGYLLTNGESNAFYDFALKAGVKVGNTFTGGDGGNGVSAPVTVSKNWGIAKFRVNVSIPANTAFLVTNQRAATDGGVAGTYNVLTNTSGTIFRGDGNLGSASAANDYTLGSGVAYGATLGTPVVNASGVMATIPVLQGGVNYASGPSLGFYYGAAGINQPGSLYPALTAPTGFGNRTGGAVTSTTVSTGGTGLSQTNPPPAFLGGGGGFGSATTAAYGPSLITGVPATRLPSVLLHGDSITAGFGSVDGAGDLNGSYGWLEQALAGQVGVHKLAVSGESAAGWNSNHTQQLNFLDYAISNGLTMDYVVVALGTNDFLTNTNTNVLTSTQNQMVAVYNLFQARGAKLVGTTVLPAVRTQAAGNKFTTLQEQAPYNQNFVPGGPVDQYNAWVKANAPGLFWGVVDASAACRDATYTHAFRVNAFGGTANAYCNDDGAIGATGFNAGIHPNVGCGIPHLKLNVPLPKFV